MIRILSLKCVNMHAVCWCGKLGRHQDDALKHRGPTAQHTLPADISRPTWSRVKDISRSCSWGGRAGSCTYMHAVLRLCMRLDARNRTPLEHFYVSVCVVSSKYALGSHLLMPRCSAINVQAFQWHTVRCSHVPARSAFTCVNFSKEGMYMHACGRL